MVKMEVTKKFIRESYNKIVKVGYCKAQFLLNDSEPFAYSCGIYGWSCDYYLINGIVISTGYGPIGESLDYELIRYYDNKAINVNREKRQMLLDEFISKIKY